MKLRVGPNTTATFVQFLEELEAALRDIHKGKDDEGNNKYEEYRSKLCLVFDNATTHTSSMVKEFCKN